MYRKNNGIAVALMCIGAFTMAYFAANLTPFFMAWDEQYHAVVGKNMADNPFHPMLYKDPAFPYDYKNWIGNHTWVHKQPLFLWQIAASIKIFGPSVMAVRLPSMVLFGLLPLFLYRIGSITINKNTGFYAGMIMASCYAPLMLINATQNTDHNDVSFLFYVTASFWAWFEYQNSKKWYWLVLIGFFSGCAVLNKWLMGLLVFIIWFFIKVILDKDRWVIKSYLPMIYSSLVALVVFVPWQIYIFSAFPQEAKHEFEHTSRHLHEAMEGHEGDWTYHFDEALNYIYGEGTLIPILIIIGLVCLNIRIDNKKYRYFIPGVIVFVYGLYTYAATKMPAFTIIVMPFVILGYGALFEWLLSWIYKYLKPVIIQVTLATICLFGIMHQNLRLGLIEKQHTYLDPNIKYYRELHDLNYSFIHQIREMDLPENTVIFNANIAYMGDMPVMFFTGFSSYMWIPDKAGIQQMINEGRKVVVADYGEIPDHIRQNPEVILIKP